LLKVAPPKNIFSVYRFRNWWSNQVDITIQIDAPEIVPPIPSPDNPRFTLPLKVLPYLMLENKNNISLTDLSRI
jgi:hypothetical protein